MDAYAGYYLEEGKLKESSSGGAASAISEGIIKSGGIVYGAAYSEDFRSAVYGYAETIEELQKFKGSKYVYVHKKIIRDGKERSVYEDAALKLKQGRIVLFTGLGCDIAALKSIAGKMSVNMKHLYTIELLCDGVTNEIVHKKFVSDIEEIYGSKVISFSVRNKKEGWVPLYIDVKFENEKEYICPFYGSEYGFAFLNFKRKNCYECRFKNHLGDLMVADYWGCRPGMKEYNENGVSLIYTQSAKGEFLLEYLYQEDFYLKKTDTEYALYYSPRYYTSHEKYDKWELFDKTIKKEGLRSAVRVCEGISAPQRLRRKKFDEIILWGTGKCFHQYISVIQEMFPVSCVVDSDQNKWGKDMGCGMVCGSPDILKDKKNSLVLIMIENIDAAFQVVNKLLDMGITEFDYFHNWRYYAERNYLGCSQ